MSDLFYIIITSDSGKTRRIPIYKKRFILASFFFTLFLAGLIFSSSLTIGMFSISRSYTRQIAALKDHLQHSTQLLAKHQEGAEQLKQQMALEIASLQMAKARQEASFSEEKDELLATAVTELNDRTNNIKEVIENLGIKVTKSSHAKRDSGGPFIALNKEKEHDQLLFKADKYLETIRYTPLGRPVTGQISSGFGTRLDPMNGEGAHHTGIDFRGKQGEKIFATGAGVVTQAHYNGNYGNFVMIDHGNGYTSSFAHLDRFLVKKGDRVERGQVIGKIGSSGRATGAHLHYEVCLKKTPINPARLMKVSGLSLSTPRKPARN
jgi:murein DD-endopeptidase MepM/ murein hydrolase activator NlpD